MPSRAVPEPALAGLIAGLIAGLAGAAAFGAVTGTPTVTLVALGCQLPLLLALWRWGRRPPGGAVAPLTALATTDAVLLDDEGRITFAGPDCAPLIGRQPDQLVGRRLGDLVLSEDAADSQDRVQLLLSAPAGTSTRWQVRGADDDGDHPPWLELSARRVMLDGERPGVLVRLRDASVGEELDTIARDELTGLTTRAEFFRRASRATAVAGPNGPAAILFCDLDGFDGVNGVYGRAAGDEVLRSVAARMRRALRPHELIGRIGGDEFGVLLPAPVSRTDAEVVAERLQTAVATPITLRGGDAVVVPLDVVVTVVDQPVAHAENVVPQTNRTASKTLST